MTETEARSKWCPFVRASAGQDDNNAANAGTIPIYRVPIYARCVGSDCMMWRWSDQLWRGCRMPDSAEEANSEQEPSRPPDLRESWQWSAIAAPDGEACWVEPRDEAQSRRNGYCGLAGKPEFL